MRDLNRRERTDCEGLASRLQLLHQSPQVMLHELHNHVDLLSSCVSHDFTEANDVRVLSALHKHVDLAQRRDRESLSLLLHLQLFESNHLVRVLLQCSVDHAEGALGYPVQQLEFVDGAAAVDSGVEDWQFRDLALLVLVFLRAELIGTQLNTL